MGYTGEEFGQQTREERSKVAGAIMMYQKTLVTRFSGKEFFTPGGTNADLTKKGLRRFSLSTIHLL